MQSLTLRPATAADAPALADLLEQLFPPRPQMDALRAGIEELAAQKGALLLAAQLPDGSVVGTAMGVACRDLCGQCRRFLVIENVVVREDAHHLGVGRALMEALEAFAREQDCGYCLLVSCSSRRGAHRFYEALGYSREAGYRKFLR